MTPLPIVVFLRPPNHPVYTNLLSIRSWKLKAKQSKMESKGVQRGSEGFSGGQETLYIHYIVAKNKTPCIYTAGKRNNKINTTSTLHQSENKPQPFLIINLRRTILYTFSSQNPLQLSTFQVLVDPCSLPVLQRY